MVQTYQNLTKKLSIYSTVIQWIPLQKPVSNELLDILNSEYLDLLEDGNFKACSALPEEADETHLSDLPRLLCHKRRGMAGRFRELIDEVNRVA